MRHAVLRSFALFTLAAACMGDGPPAPTPIVQIVSIDAGGTVVACGLTPSPDSIYINVHMVNTMNVDVPISSVDTWGVVIRASNDSVGYVAIDLRHLPIVPDPVILAARVGDVTFRMSMPTRPLCTNNPYHSSWRDIQTQVRVTTPVGQYASVALTIRVQ